MSERRVRRILGPPDDVITAADRDSGLRGSERIWCYGTAGHRTLPTLGSVLFEDGQARMVCGGRGSPPRAGLFEEAEIRRLLRTIDGVPEPDARAWDPLPAIRIVNALHPLGKDKALAAVGEYARVTDCPVSDSDMRSADWGGVDRPGLFAVLNVLFETPGASGLRLYTCALLDDVPLYLDLSAPFSGEGGDWLAFLHVHWDLYRRYGRMRTRPLRPIDDGLRVLEMFPGEGPAPGRPGGEARALRLAVMNQLLRLIAPSFRPDSSPGDKPRMTQDRRSVVWRSDLEGRWPSIAAQVARLHLRWDARAQAYAAGSARDRRSTGGAHE
jgi:hypothetical protein